MKEIFNKILRSIFPHKLSREAFVAYYYRLPEEISVDWQRDGDFIIGTISDGENEFVTQGKDVDDFIEMVNDALITVHDIPAEYIHALKSASRTYKPNDSQRKALEDVSITHSNLSFHKNEEVLRAA